jgi:glycosyltransferase involved in cell wall biosynthesis
VKLAVHNDGGAVRGSERQLILVLPELVRRGHEVVVSCRRGAGLEGELRRLGIPTTSARPGGDADPWNAARFYRWLRRERPDALLLTSWKRSPLAAALAKRAGVPRVVFRFGGRQHVHPGRAGWKYRTAFLRWFDAVYVNSAGMVEHVRREVPRFPRERLFHVPNAVPAPPAESTLRAELGIPAEALVVAAVGGLDRQKRVELVVDAFARGAPADARLVVAGDGPLRGELEARAAALGVAGRVHWLGVRGDVPHVLAGADLMVHASANESMANVMLEGMAAGLLVVCTAVYGAADALGPSGGHGPAGWVVPVDDGAAVTAAVAEAARLHREEPAAAAALRAEARRRAEAWFGVAATASGVEAVLLGTATPAP